MLHPAFDWNWDTPICLQFVQVILFQNLNKLCQLQTATKQQTDDHTSLPVTTDVCYDCTTNKRKSTKIQKKTNNPTSSISYHKFTILVLVLCLFFSPILSPSHTENPACHQRFPANLHVPCLPPLCSKQLGQNAWSTPGFLPFCQVRRHWRWRWTWWWICQYHDLKICSRLKYFVKKRTFLMDLWPVL